jgi:SpoIIAA-like
MHAILRTEGNISAVRVSGKLSDKDYKDLTPHWEKMIAMHGKIRMLIEMEEFDGWDLHAGWDDFRFNIKHGHEIERCAMLGDKKWEEWLTKAALPFARGRVRYFDRSQADEAWEWLREPEL